VAEMHKRILVQEGPFDVGSETSDLSAASKSTGAVATFIGLVRDINDDESVNGLFLEHYPGMTEKSIDGILDEAAQRWPLQSVTVIHRVGQLEPGDLIVFVGTASEHRQAAFASCEFIMDYLKTKAPFWKKETTSDGNRWLTTRTSDVDAAASWQVVKQTKAEAD